MTLRTNSDNVGSIPTGHGAGRQLPLKAAPTARVPEFDDLIDAHQNALIRYAYRRLRSPDLAQDVVQEAFLRYLHKPSTEFKGPEHRGAWLFRVTHNLCIDHVKRESRRGEIYEALEPAHVAKFPLSEILSAERWERLEGLLERLSGNQRTVMLLYFQDKKSYRDISEITGQSLSNVGMLLHRGLKKLRILIDEKGSAEF